MGFGKRLSHESASPSSRSVQKTLSLSPEGPVVRSGENVTLVCSSESAFDQFHLLRDGENLGCPLLEGRAPMEHSRQSSLLVQGPQPTVGSTGAMAPSLTLPTSGQTPATHCYCLSQVRNLFLAQALLFLFSRYVVSNSLPPCGLQHDRLLCPSLSPPHGSQPCSGEGAFIPQ